MKTFFSLLILIFFSLSLQASELKFFEGKQEYVFDFDKNNHLILSKECNKKCQAYLSLKKVTKGKVLRDGGANPGAIICVEQLGGKVKTLTDKEQDQSSFCEFEDKSLVGLGSLQKIWQDLGK